MKYLKVIGFVLIIVSTFSCGVKESNKTGEIISSAIVNGEDGNMHEYPWQVSLQKRGKNNLKHFCGGSIISKRFVLTAAHCINTYRKESPSFTVKGGGNGDRYRLRALPKVSEIYIHENYINDLDNGILKNDIGLVQFSDDISFDETIVPINLPYENIDFDNILNNELYNIVTSGWGRLGSGKNLPRQLQVLEDVKLFPLPNDDYWQDPRNKGKFHYLKDTKKLIIPVVELYQINEYLAIKVKNSKSVCEGDSGGPLALKNERLLIGVASSISNGDSCKDSVTAFFTNTAKHYKWINDTIEDAMLLAAEKREEIKLKLEEVQKKEKILSEKYETTGKGFVNRIKKLKMSVKLKLLRRKIKTIKKSFKPFLLQDALPAFI